MSLLIAGFGDLGRQIAHLHLQSSSKIPGPVLALSRSVRQLDLPPGIKAITADLTDPDSLRVIPDSVTHLVYCASADASDPHSYEAIYVEGLRNVLNAILAKHGHTDEADRTADTASAVKANGYDAGKSLRVVFVSSTAVYAKSLEGWVDECSPTEPDRFNGKIMLQAESLCQQMVPQAQILRLSGIYGPGRTYLLKRLVAGTATIPASADYWANRIHIEDAARAVLHLLNLDGPGSTYIGTDCFPLPLREAYLDLANRLAAPAPQEGAPNAMMGKKRLSNKKLLESGFEFCWPDSRTGYQTVIDTFLKSSSP